MGKRRKRKNTLGTKFRKFCIEFSELSFYCSLNLNFSRVDISNLELEIKGLLSKCLSLQARMKNEQVVNDAMETALRTRENALKKILHQVRLQYIEAFCNIHKYNIDAQNFLDFYKTPMSLNIKNVLKKALKNGRLNDYCIEKKPNVHCDIKRHFTIHSGETNTGKTYNALLALTSAASGVYLAPLRLLALEVCQTLNESGIPCELLTGEEHISVPFANHLSSTVEMLNPQKVYELAVIDECQMLSDKYRGKAWTNAILRVQAEEVHVCCAPNAVNILVRLIKECGDTYSIRNYTRNTDLLFEEKPFAFPNGVESGDALIAFSKKSVLGISSELASFGVSSSVIYGSLPPEARRKQIKLFMDKETEVIVATDAIGMGINIPIKRVVFMETFKFDGERRRFISKMEIKQIAGRAGRKNMYDSGYVNSLRDRNRVKKLFEEKLLPLDRAYYFPPVDFLLGLPDKTLRDRLEYCLRSRAGKNFITADISAALYLMSFLEKEDYGLTIEEQCRLIFLPFSTGDKRLVECWLSFIQTYAGKKPLKPPRHVWYSSCEIDILEYRYKLLDLYYSFCKALNITFDEERVTNRKYVIAESIHNLLRTGIKKLGSKCATCGKRINWSHPRSLCDKCFEKNMEKSEDME